MAITRAQVNGVEALAAWLNENAADYFSSVTYTSNELTARDADENIVFSMGGYVSGNLAVRSYRSAESYITSGALTSVTTIDIIKCDNGIIIDFYYNWNGGKRFGILIAKTNNDKIAVISSAGGDNSTTTNYLYNKLQHVALGDSPTMATTTTFTPESGNQTVITPFITNADVGGKSYTPSAGYMPAHSNYGSGLNKFLLGADMYITNGYWCIKDGGAA